MLPPLGGALHENGGGLAIALPNWSNAVAANCCVWFCSTVALEGETLMLVTIALTVTSKGAVLAIVPAEIDTGSVYVPALKKVTDEFLARLLPLTPKTGAGAPLGALRVDHV